MSLPRRRSPFARRGRWTRTSLRGRGVKSQQWLGRESEACHDGSAPPGEQRPDALQHGDRADPAGPGRHGRLGQHVAARHGSAVAPVPGRSEHSAPVTNAWLQRSRGAAGCSSSARTTWGAPCSGRLRGDDDAVGRGVVDPGPFNVGQWHRARSDRERVAAQRGGELGERGDDVSGGDRSLAASDELEPAGAKGRGGDRGLQPGDGADLDPGQHLAVVDAARNDRA